MTRPLSTRSMRVKAVKCRHSGKRAYRSELDAKIAMAGTADSVRREKVEQRVYPCGGHFHLTSQSIEEYEARKRQFGV